VARHLSGLMIDIDGQKQVEEQGKVTFAPSWRLFRMR
jgi:hypothetical protein